MQKLKIKKRSKSSTKDNGTKFIATKILIGSAVGAAFFFILLALSALLALKQDMDPKNFDIIVLVVCALSSALCSYVSVRQIQKNGLILGMISAFALYFIVLIVVSIVNRAPLSTTGWAALGVMLVFGAAAGVFAANKKKKIRYK